VTSRSIPLICLAAAVLLAASAAPAAGPFAEKGARGTLTVDYRYESIGKKQDEYDLHEWRVERSVQISAELAAQPAAPAPQLQPPDAAYMAEQQKKLAQAQASAEQMAPLMARAEQIVAKCGEDEACIERETMKLGAAMAGTPEMEQAQQAGAGIQALGQGYELRYQIWRATGQQGRYSIDESEHIVHSDPICMELPNDRCTRDELRKGAGALAPPGTGAAAAGFAAVELDAQKNTLTVQLPMALEPLAYTETITTDEPEGTHSVPTPKGPQPRRAMFRVGPKGPTLEPFTVPLAAGARVHGGERVVMLEGDAGEAGKLTVRWRFEAH
jgi:hypothetical protein